MEYSLPIRFKRGESPVTRWVVGGRVFLLLHSLTPQHFPRCGSDKDGVNLRSSQWRTKHCDPAHVGSGKSNSGPLAHRAISQRDISSYTITSQSTLDLRALALYGKMIDNSRGTDTQ